jgi:hypothetical protein
MKSFSALGGARLVFAVKRTRSAALIGPREPARAVHRIDPVDMRLSVHCKLERVRALSGADRIEMAIWICIEIRRFYADGCSERERW